MARPLTVGERDVLRLLGIGLSNADIGERLHLGLTTAGLTEEAGAERP
ncbi:hypothetical protein [Micromonospora sp. MW-13]|nr:hypothetical protein [Micromonospora sp. MW-13]